MEKFHKPVKETFRLNFRGFLSVELMEFDYAGQHYSYHGRKLEHAVNRLTADEGPIRATTAELVIWGRAVSRWRELNSAKEK